MEASWKSVFLLALLVSSYLSSSSSSSIRRDDVQTLKSKQQTNLPKLPCKTDADCARQCEGPTHHCLNSGTCLCVPGFAHCC
ncbi:hypothetical protein QYF36_012435 [Acer negundo]|nr:hypothetical protein QYF36_012435 [Acer negundo]